VTPFAGQSLQECVGRSLSGFARHGHEAGDVRLTLARKLAAIVLTIWKKGGRFDPEQLKRQAA
jgi:hypothetical protein